jgi:hypothetical protein
MLIFKFFFKESKGSKSSKQPAQVQNGTTNGQSSQINPNQPHQKTATLNNSTNQMNMNEMPIYSQVQKPYGTNRNLVITNGTTNADSWV